MTAAPTCPDYDWGLQIQVIDKLAKQADVEKDDIQYIGVVAGVHVSDCATCMDWFMDHDFTGKESQLILGIAHGINQMIIETRKREIQTRVARPRKQQAS